MFSAIDLVFYSILNHQKFLIFDRNQRISFSAFAAFRLLVDASRCVERYTGFFLFLPCIHCISVLSFYIDDVDFSCVFCCVLFLQRKQVSVSIN